MAVAGTETAGSRDRERVRFTVDAKLLRELGEKLVGQPHIALAELVKNAYDADATRVRIRIRDDSIEVTDNGHGMTRTEFEEFWMRIGSTHKSAQRVSRGLQRPLTGSKGVGRLAVQLLARQLDLTSVSVGAAPIDAEIDWDSAVSSDELTQATALVGINGEPRLLDGAQTGTSLVLTDLNQEWTRAAVADLASELWPLQPPFEPALTDPHATAAAFAIDFDADDQGAVALFRMHMTAVLEIYTARLRGRLLPAGAPISAGAPRVTKRTDNTSELAPLLRFESPGADDNPGQRRAVDLLLEFHTGQRYSETYVLDGCHLNTMDFEVRVFTLKYRQPYGVSVSQAREYLNKFGGVHVYDAGFHLPYYGPDNDWLAIEQDHAHRLSSGRVLPASLNVSAGMQYLPSNSRLFGVVNIDTAAEERWATEMGGLTALRDALRIQVSRDRLVDTQAAKDLAAIVRWAVEYYAVKAAGHRFEEIRDSQEAKPTPGEAIGSVVAALEHFESEIPADVYAPLKEAVTSAADSTTADLERRQAESTILASAATAGILALAYEHEIAKQFREIDSVIRDLRTGEPFAPESIANRLEKWSERARATRHLFSPLLDEGNRTERRAFSARELIEAVSGQTYGLARGTRVGAGRVDPSLRLPSGTFSAWSAVFQNLFINAYDATLDSQERRIDVSSGRDGGNAWILVQDTGAGVDLATADDLFRPFERRLKVSPDRAGLVLGGSGLGLFIVRMLGDQLGCAIRFVKPEPGFSTAVSISWKE